MAKQGQQKPPKPKTLADYLKLGGVILCFVASITLFVHRIPKTHYVEAHADKPRPRAVSEEASMAAAPAVPRFSVKPKLPPKPAPAPVALQPVAAQSGGDASTVNADWQDACLGEIGILCNHVEEGRLLKCLRPYEVVLRKSCRKALNWNHS